MPDEKIKDLFKIATKIKTEKLTTALVPFVPDPNAVTLKNPRSIVSVDGPCPIFPNNDEQREEKKQRNGKEKKKERRKKKPGAGRTYFWRRYCKRGLKRDNPKTNIVATLTKPAKKFG